MRHLLDTNVVSDLVRNPQGRVAEHIRRVGEAQVCTSTIVAAELRYGAAKKGSPRLTRQLEVVLGALDVLPFAAPADTAYGEIRTRLEQVGGPIGGNDLLIAARPDRRASLRELVAVGQVTAIGQPFEPVAPLISSGSMM